MGEIKSIFDSIALWIATKIRFKHCAIRFKYHAIWYWFDSNFNDSIQETRDLKRNLEVVVEILILITHYSIRSYLQMFGFTHHWCMPAIIRSLLLSGEAWTARSMHVNALLRKWKFQWLPLAGTNKIEICLLKLFCCFRIWDLIWDLEFEDSRFWCEIRFKIWDLAWIFESPVKKIWDFRVNIWFEICPYWSVLSAKSGSQGPASQWSVS